MFGPVLRGERISLEPPRREDSAIRIAWFADFEVTRYFTSPGVPVEQADIESAERTARTDDVVLWRITLEGRTIGSCFLSSIDWRNRHALSGMMIGDRTVWGRGYATEAVRLRTRFAFEEMNLQRLESESIDANIGMHRALERNGYRRFATRRRHYFIGGTWHDEHLFELMRDEWEASSAT